MEKYTVKKHKTKTGQLQIEGLTTHDNTDSGPKVYNKRAQQLEKPSGLNILRGCKELNPIMWTE